VVANGQFTIYVRQTPCGTGGLATTVYSLADVCYLTTPTDINYTFVTMDSGLYQFMTCGDSSCKFCSSTNYPINTCVSVSQNSAWRLDSVTQDSIPYPNGATVFKTYGVALCGGTPTTITVNSPTCETSGGMIFI